MLKWNLPKENLNRWQQVRDLLLQGPNHKNWGCNYLVCVRKKLFNEQIVEIRNTYSEMHEKHKYFKQEYTTIKESEAVLKIGFEKYSIKLEELSNLCEKLERERDRLKVALDSGV